MRTTLVTVALALLAGASTVPLGAASGSAEGSDVRGQAPVLLPSDDPQAEAEAREQRIRERTEKARREAQFNQLDADGDGYLSQAELQGEVELAAERDNLDRDDDGRVSRSEFAALEVLPEAGQTGSEGSR